MTEDKDSKLNNSKIYDWLVGILLLLVVFAAWRYLWYWVDNNVLAEDRGEFGDKFGYVNALFSALAFAGIIFTIILQKRELGLQREELEKTREVFDEQSKTMKLQRFENTFFELLKIHNSLISEVEITKGSIGGKGILAFEALYYFMKDIASDKNEPADVVDRFSGLSFYPHYKRYQYSLYSILDMVDKNVFLSQQEKKYYVQIIKNRFDEYEMYVNAMSLYVVHDAFLNQIPLNEKYRLYERLNKSSIRDKNISDWVKQIINYR